MQGLLARQFAHCFGSQRKNNIFRDKAASIFDIIILRLLQFSDIPLGFKQVCNYSSVLKNESVLNLVYVHRLMYPHRIPVMKNKFCILNTFY